MGAETQSVSAPMPMVLKMIFRAVFLSSPQVML